MKGKASRKFIVAAFAVVTAMCLFVGLLVAKQEPFNAPQLHDGDVRSLGNMVTIYTNNVCMAFLQGKDFANGSLESGDGIDLDSHAFMRQIPKTIPYNAAIGDQLRQIPDINSILAIPNNGGIWLCQTDNVYRIWQTIRPFMHNILDTAFAAVGLRGGGETDDRPRCPIIHFRCSDVPFIKHGEYHLMKHSFYTDCLEKCRARGIDVSTVKIMYAPYHHDSGEPNVDACNQFVDALAEHLRANGYPRVVIGAGNHETSTAAARSQSNLHDYAELFYAAAVISSGSSFSFTSGFLGSGVLMSDGHFHETSDVTQSACVDCEKDFLVKSGYMLLHKDVPRYDDSEAVLKQLREK